LNPEVWGQPLRKDVVHSTLVWWRACQREGTHKAKGKGEVSGTGKKPFPQKGRGKARQGSRRSPQFVGGGVAHPPVPRDYSYQLPKRVRARARRARGRLGGVVCRGVRAKHAQAFAPALVCSRARV
jgi:large subunit ribosomal protein L4